jgi:predicted permease
MADPSTPSADARRSIWTSEVRARLSPLRLSPAREAEIVDELSQHLEDRFRDSIAGGASPEEATRMALADFRSGNVLAQHMARLKQANTAAPTTLGTPTGSVLNGLWQDLRHAARIFWKQPAFAATAVLTLALGIGATTAIFSVVYGVLLKPLPFPEAERLVSLKQYAPYGAGRNHGRATYLTYRENQQAFEEIGAWDPVAVSVTGAGDPERLEALMVSSSTLPLLRVQPIVGRAFTTEDDTPDSPLRVLLAYGYWQRRFGGANTVVGQRLVIDGSPAEVIGVLPSSFRFLRTHPDVVLPMPLDVAAPRFISFGFQALARLKPGVTLAQGNAEVARLISLLPPMFARLELRPDVRPLADDVIGNVGDILWILLAAVGVVLLIACGNAANLFLIRAEVRQQELAMRAALGASRGRLSRALLSESVLLGVAGGVLGVGLAQAAIGVLRWMAPTQLPRLEDIGINAAVLVFTVAVSMMSGLFSGLFAVAKFGKPGTTALKEGGRGASDTPGRHRTRNTLVVAQVGLALTLLAVSGLMIRTFVAMRQVDPGFTRPQEVQTFVVAIPPGVISDDEQAARIHQRVAEQLAQIAGVTSVGLSSSITMDGENNTNPIEIQGFPHANGTVPPLRRFKSLGPGYFETMGNHMVAGRSVTWGDILEQKAVVVISEPLAREYWSHTADAIGKYIRSYPGAPWREIIGVVGPERDDGLNHPSTSMVYWPILNETYRWRTMAYAVRSPRVGTEGFLRELERGVWSVNPTLPLADIQTLADIEANSMAQTSFTLVMLAIAASVALLIATVGIYGAIAYTAAQRTREVGVRMALGAQTRDVRRMFVRYGLSLTAIGIVVGVAASMGLTRVMSSFLFGVDPTDPITYLAASAALAAVAVVAAYIPARRAASTDPIVALRAEV